MINLYSIMTFINSFLNKLSDVDEQFINEQWTLYKLFKFNDRRCYCCTCATDYEIADYFDAKIGDKYMCVRALEGDIDDDNCECHCQYPVCDQPIVLTDEQINDLIIYFNEHGVPVTHESLEFLDSDLKPNSSWNNKIITNFHLKPNDIQDLIHKHRAAKFNCFITNFNFLQTICGAHKLTPKMK